MKVHSQNWKNREAEVDKKRAVFTITRKRSAALETSKMTDGTKKTERECKNYLQWNITKDSIKKRKRLQRSAMSWKASLQEKECYKGTKRTTTDLEDSKKG